MGRNGAAHRRRPRPATTPPASRSNPVLVEDASPFMGTKAPPSGGFEGSPTGLFIYVEDVDAVIERAVELGATMSRG